MVTFLALITVQLKPQKGVVTTTIVIKPCLHHDILTSEVRYVLLESQSYFLKIIVDAFNETRCQA